MCVCVCGGRALYKLKGPAGIPTSVVPKPKAMCYVLGGPIPSVLGLRSLREGGKVG